MKAATITLIKNELKDKDAEELVDLCLRLARFRLENKELLTYLLFDAEDEEGYRKALKLQLDAQYEAINTTNYYYMKKSVRKILKSLKIHLRYSGNKESEVELLLYFCQKLRYLQPSISNNTALQNLYNRQLDFVEKRIGLLHEDLQFDFGKILEQLRQ